MIKFFYRKGVAMHVSAISANHCNMVASKHPIVDKKENIKNNSNAETLHTSIVTKVNKELNLDKVYLQMNEWKLFCHRQIMDGKLNIIA